MKNLTKYLTPEYEEAFRITSSLKDDERWAAYLFLLKEGGIFSLTEIREIFDSTYQRDATDTG